MSVKTVKEDADKDEELEEILTPQDKAIKMIEKNNSLRNLIEEFNLELI